MGLLYYIGRVIGVVLGAVVDLLGDVAAVVIVRALLALA
jgi:hypothetical protein